MIHYLLLTSEEIADKREHFPSSLLDNRQNRVAKQSGRWELNFILYRGCTSLESTKAHCGAFSFSYSSRIVLSRAITMRPGQ